MPKLLRWTLPFHLGPKKNEKSKKSPPLALTHQMSDEIMSGKRQTKIGHVCFQELRKVSFFFGGGAQVLESPAGIWGSFEGAAPPKANPQGEFLQKRVFQILEGDVCLRDQGASS